MPQMHVGSMLRSRREQLNISLQRAALDTNIRGRVLEAIENNDFKNYPPSGHARAMVSSYARYLGLDPHPVLKQLENDLKQFKSNDEMAMSADRTRRGVGRFGERVSSEDKPLPREASKRQGTGKNIRKRRLGPDEQPDKLNESLRHEMAAEQDDRYKSGTVKVVGTRQTGSFSRVRSGRGATGEMGRIGATRTGIPASSSPSGRLTRTGQKSPAPSPSTAGATGSFKRRNSRVTSATAVASSPSKSGKIEVNGEELSFFSTSDDGKKSTRRRKQDRRVSQAKKAAEEEPKNIVEKATRAIKAIFEERRTRMIAIALIAIVLAIIVAASILINTAGNRNGGVIEVQGGVQDTTTTTRDSNTATATITTTNGNPISVKIEVGEGKTSLVNVTYDDDNAYSGTAIGPWYREFLVTSSLSATFGTPDAVKVTENGNEVEITKNEDGTGALNLNIQTTSSNTVNSADAHS